MGLFDEENKRTKRLLTQKVRTLSKRDERIFHLDASLLGVYGWQMAMPVLLSILLGRSLDKYAPTAYFSWTLNLIIIGFAVGIFNANRWVRQKGLLENKRKKK